MSNSDYHFNTMIILRWFFCRILESKEKIAKRRTDCRMNREIFVMSTAKASKIDLFTQLLIYFLMLLLDIIPYVAMVKKIIESKNSVLWYEENQK